MTRNDLILIAVLIIFSLVPLVPSSQFLVPKKIGIMGGTFDPIHLGHLATAEAVRELFALDEILFIPAARPPHKLGRHVTDERHRLTMTLLATRSAVVVFPHHFGPSISTAPVASSFSCRITSATRFLYSAIAKGIIPNLLGFCQCALPVGAFSLCRLASLLERQRPAARAVISRRGAEKKDSPNRDITARAAILRCGTRWGMF